MDLRIYKNVFMGDLSEDEVPQGFWFHKELQRNTHHVEKITKGLITSEVFYEDLEEDRVILRVDYTYQRDSAGIILSQHAELTHYQVDGEEAKDGPYEFTREYTPREIMGLISARRTTVTSTVKGAVLKFLEAAGYSEKEALRVGGAFIVTHTAALTAYETSGDPQFAENVKVLPDEWLDTQVPVAPGVSVSIRDFIVSEME